MSSSRGKQQNHFQRGKGRENQSDRGRGGNNPNRGRGEHHSNRGRGEHHSDRGGGEHHSNRGRGEHHSDRGGGEHHSNRGRTEHHSDRGGSEHHSNRGRAEHHSDRGGREHHSNRGRAEHHSNRGRGEHHSNRGQEEHHFNRGRGEHHSNRGRTQIGSSPSNNYFDTEIGEGFFQVNPNENPSRNRRRHGSHSRERRKDNKYEKRERERQSVQSGQISSISTSNLHPSQLMFGYGCHSSPPKNITQKYIPTLQNTDLFSPENVVPLPEQTNSSTKEKQIKNRKKSRRKKEAGKESKRNWRQQSKKPHNKTSQLSVQNLLLFNRQFSEQKFDRNEESETILSSENQKQEKNQHMREEPQDIRSNKSELTDSENSFEGSDSSFEQIDSIESDTDTLDTSSVISNTSIKKTDSYIGVYWDIENCPVPNKKTAADIVKKIRNKFYGKCTEAEFIVSCDITKISKTIITELNDAQVAVVHVDCHNKNAADTKLKTYLRRFVDSYKQPNSRVVLISGDCDFVTELHDLRYRHKIKVIVLHNSQAKRNLKDVANTAEIFEDFCEDLPDACAHYHLIIENLPKNETQKQLQQCLTHILKDCSFNGLSINGSNADVYFNDPKELKKAVKMLNKAKVFGNEITVREITDQNANKERQKIPPKQQNVEKKKKSEAKKAEAGCKEITLQPKKEIFMSLRVNESRNASFWQSCLNKVLSKVGFKIEEVNDNEKTLTVAFDSTNKAKKAAKLIEKQRAQDSLISSILNINSTDNKNEIEKCLQILESKKEHYIKLHSKKTKAILEEQTYINIPANIDVKEYQNVNENRLESMEKQKEEFVTYIKNQQELLQRYINAPRDTFMKLMDTVKKRVDIECQCFASENPAYEKKSNIVRILEEDNICLLRTNNHAYDYSQVGYYLPMEENKKTLYVYPISKVCKMASLNEEISSIDNTNKNSSNVISLTDYSLLRYCLQNPKLENISCVIVDNIQEKRLYTDILLLLLRKILMQNVDLKVILITEDIASVKLFFKLKDEVILDISEYLYPVSIVWRSCNIDAGYNYIQGCVEEIVRICQKPDINGDIVVFLTSMSDIEQAILATSRCLELNNIKDFALLRLHELQNLREQKELLSLNKNNKKIIFTTDYGRISKFLPTVTNVVDCGFVLREGYNPDTSGCELWLELETKDCANMRKDCAGRQYPGICYRLFNNKDYDEKMFDKITPETAYQDLSHLILLLWEGGVNPFDFNKYISLKHLAMFHQKLFQLNALQDNVLTDVGIKMAKLPFDPNIAKLFIRGMEEEIPILEVSISAALAILTGYVNFQYSIDGEAKHWKFHHADGDRETIRIIYDEWLKVPKKSKRDWCKINHISSNCLELFHELVNDVLMCASKLCTTPKKKRRTLDGVEVDTKLQKLMIEIFPDNLCVYSGYGRQEYQNVCHPGYLSVDTLSAMRDVGTSPKFIIFHKVLRSQNVFMLGVISIKEEILLEMEQNGTLPFTVSELNMKVMVPTKISNLGVTLLKHIKGEKTSIIEENIRNITKNERCKVEVNIQKEEVTIYTNPKGADDAKALLIDTLNTEKTRMLEYENEISFPHWSSNGFRILIGCGAEIKRVLMPDECRQVQVQSALPLDDILKRLSVYGVICNQKIAKNKFHITYTSPESAQKAITGFYDEDTKISSAMELTTPFDDPPPFRVDITWLRRYCTGSAFINFKTENEVHEMLSKFSNLCIEIKGTKVRVQMNKKNKKSVILFGLPKSIIQSDIVSSINALLSFDEYESIIIARRQPYESTDEEILVLTQTLYQVFGKYTDHDKLSVEIERPHEKSVVWRAVLQFQTIQDGYIATRAIKDDSLEGLEIKPDLKYSIRCHSQLFSSVQKQLQESLESFNTGEKEGDTLKIVAKKVGSDVTITVSSNNINDLIKLISLFQKMLEGACISGLTEREVRCLLDDGMKLIKSLEDNFSVCIRVDQIQKKISICGETQSCCTARRIINNHLSMLKNSQEFELAGQNKPKGLLCALAKTYGKDFSQLKTSCNLAALELQFEERSLIGYGKEEAFVELYEHLENFSKKLKDCEEESDQVCFICYGSLDKDYYRLSYCGHAFCKQCLLVQIGNSGPPLLCQNNNCRKSFVWEDIKCLVKGKKQILQSVLMKSLVKFFDENKDVYENCPTIGCCAVYKKPKQTVKVFHCADCENDICTRCNVIYHHGLSCEMFWSIIGKDEAVKAWIQEDSSRRKFCENCNAGIENNCCWKCGVDFA